MPDLAPLALAPPVRTVVRLAPPAIAAVDLAPAMEAAQPRGPPSLFALGCSLLV
jgi:hypothetical protein